MAIELPDGPLSPDDGTAIGTFLLEMAYLERAVTRALLDLYATDTHRELFLRTFLKRMSLGPKCDAMISAAVEAETDDGITRQQIDDLARQLRELVEVRNRGAHDAPRFLHYVDESSEWWNWEDQQYEYDVDSIASYGDLEIADLLTYAGLISHARAVISIHFHRPLSDPDAHDENPIE